MLYLEEEKEIINEEKNEEQPQEEVELEVKDEETPKETQSLIDDKIPNERNYIEVVEELRLQILAENRKQQRVTKISGFSMMIFLVAAIVFIMLRSDDNNTLFLTLGITFMVIALVILITGSILNKRINRIDAKKDYIIPSVTAINRFTFDDPKFIKATHDYEEKIPLSALLEDNVYTGITDLVSRNVVHTMYKNMECYIGELGIFVGGTGRQRRTSFIGKYISADNKVHFEGQYILLSKGETEIDIPEISESLTKLSEQDKFVIYGKEGADYKKDLGSEFINKIKAIKIEGVLLNIAVNVSAGRTSIYLSFDDPVTTLPFFEPLKNQAIETYKEILMQAMDAAESID